MGAKELAEYDASGPHITLTDHLGSPRILVPASGPVVYQKFTPFGESLTTATDAAQFAKGFTNHEQTDPSGLIYMQARFYLPGWGRFASPDPGRDQHFEQTQSWNIYSYVQNNPVQNIDPTGMVHFRTAQTIHIDGADYSGFARGSSSSAPNPCSSLVGGANTPSGEGAQQDDEAQSTLSQKPSGLELLGNAVVKTAIDKAYADANVTVPSVQPNGRHEEGGKIFRNNETGEPLVVRAPRGEGATVSLNAVSDTMKGFSKVGEFHIHPNPTLNADGSKSGWIPSSGASSGPKKSADWTRVDHPAVRVPSIIRSDQGYHVYGYRTPRGERMSNEILIPTTIGP